MAISEKALEDYFLAEFGWRVLPVAGEIAGMKIVIDTDMPADEIEFRQNGKVIGRITNIGTD